MTLGRCKLCAGEADLQLSHILPAFAHRWLRQSSGGGHIRLGQEPNRRVQDGLKRHWLCRDCEGRLSRSEKLFADRIFHPYNLDSSIRVPYSHWLIEFATSISWRVLCFYRDDVGLHDWDAEALEHVNAAEAVWREVLLGVRPHPDQHQQHLLPLDRVQSTSANLPPNINRYIMRAIDMDIVRGGRSVFTFAKLGRFIFLGFVREPALKNWRGTKIHATAGVLEPRQYAVPHPFGDYISGKARRMSELLQSISPAQKVKIDDTLRKNVDRYLGSDAFAAMLADLDLFGDEAFACEDSSAP